MEATQEQQLDTALNKIMSELVAWGLCESEAHYELGYRTPEVLRLSVAGANHLYDLVNTLTGEIERLEKIIAYIDAKVGN
jgi:hypothetical protein